MTLLRTLNAIKQETSSVEGQPEEYERLHHSSTVLLGIQTWNVFKQAPVRRWETVKSYLVLGHSVNDVAEKLDNLIQLDSQVAKYEANADTRLQKMGAALVKLEDLGNRLEDLRERQKAAVVVMAERHLTMLNDRLKEYLAKTRLAIARLYDNELRRNANSGGLGEYE